MKRVVFLAGIPVLSLALLGCADLVRELKDDPAILGTTGFYVSIGFDPSPQNSFFPLPHVALGNGTAWRLGIHDCVYVTTAAGASAFVSVNQAAVTQTISAKTEELGQVNKGLDAIKGDTTPEGVAAQAKLMQRRAELEASLGQYNQLKAAMDDLAAEKKKAESDTSEGQKAKVEEAQRKVNALVAALQVTEAGGRGNLASCIPGGAAISGPSSGGSGAAGSAYLTIAADGLGAVKERWSKDADVARQLLELVRDGKLTSDQAIEIIRLIRSAPAATAQGAQGKQ